MPYLQRNLYYVRVSPHAVLQTILYVDPSNLRWLNSGLYSDNDDDEFDLTGAEQDDRDRFDDREKTGDRVWARALMHLREKVMPKLRREAAEGGTLSSNNVTTRGKVDTHIDVDFQMAYFFRQTNGRHAVLLKNKELIFPPKVEMPPPMLPASAMRGPREELRPSRLAERQTDLDGDGGVLEESEAIAEGDEAGARKRPRSPASIRVKAEDETGGIELIHADEVVDRPNEALHEPRSIDVDQEDQKPRVQVSYSGFQIFGKSLIIVIEPTRRTKRLRAQLFQARKREEVHQLSAVPISDEERAASVRPTGGSVRADSRANTSTPRLFRTDRADSLASSFDGDDEVTGSGLVRADSRRNATDPNRPALFRGTPSEWDPTPTPTPAPEERRPVPAAEVEDDTDEGGILNAQSVMLATQMMEADASTNRVNDLDDDDDL